MGTTPPALQAAPPTVHDGAVGQAFEPDLRGNLVDHAGPETRHPHGPLEKETSLLARHQESRPMSGSTALLISSHGSLIEAVHGVSDAIDKLLLEVYATLDE